MFSTNVLLVSSLLGATHLDLADGRSNHVPDYQPVRAQAGLLNDIRAHNVNVDLTSHVGNLLAVRPPGEYHRALAGTAVMVPSGMPYLIGMSRDGPPPGMLRFKGFGPASLDGPATPALLA